MYLYPDSRAIRKQFDGIFEMNPTVGVKIDVNFLSKAERSELR